MSRKEKLEKVMRSSRISKLVSFPDDTKRPSVHKYIKKSTFPLLSKEKREPPFLTICQEMTDQELKSKFEADPIFKHRVLIIISTVEKDR